MAASSPTPTTGPDRRRTPSPIAGRGVTGQAIRIYSNGPAVTVTRTATAQPLADYVASMQVETEPGTGVGTISLEFRDPDEASLLVVTSSPQPLSDSFSGMSVSATAPEGTTHLRIRVGVTHVGGGDFWVYFDNASLGETLAVPTATPGEDWTTLALSPVQAPAGAESARIRLMLRAPEPAAAAFDEMVFRETRPPAVSAATTTPTPRPGTPTPAPAGRAVQPDSPDGTNAASAAGSTGAGTGDLRISEIMSNPAQPGQDSAFEWVELFNAGDSVASTEGWKHRRCHQPRRFTTRRCTGRRVDRRSWQVSDVPG